MPSGVEKKPRLVRFIYEELPLSQRNMEELLLIAQMLAVDRERVLQIEFPGYDDPAEIRIAALTDGYYLGLSFPMDEFGWAHPLILAAENLPIEDVRQVLCRICGEGKSTEDIPAVMEKLKDVSASAFGEERKEHADV